MHSKRMTTVRQLLSMQKIKKVSSEIACYPDDEDEDEDEEDDEEEKQKDEMAHATKWKI